ncbi:MAG: 3-phosphoshikimate 1-carboxyvinyltransferase, partial [Muribaculaceae bacterium]|nr:3-phosphoshikimate 1-carboxyvinyltransferase [Muribaculaceae bacterium]
MITLPPSKSIANREMLIDALCIMDNAQWQPSSHSQYVSDDILAMRRGLAARDGDTIDVDGAGTALRFLTAYWATREGCTVTITGNPRLCERPIAPLVNALRQLGADIVYAAQEGHAPLRITGRRLHAGHLTMRGDVSSQFVSALLMVAPTIGGMELELTGDIVSRPYIDMTVALMGRHGVRVSENDGTFIVPADRYLP